MSASEPMTFEAIWADYRARVKACDPSAEPIVRQDYPAEQGGPPPERFDRPEDADMMHVPPGYGTLLKADHPPEGPIWVRDLNVSGANLVERTRWRDAGIADLTDADRAAGVRFTCDGCGASGDCEWAFDTYNTSGDCLALK